MATDETCDYCDGSEMYQGLLTHRPTCATLTGPAEAAAAISGQSPRRTDADGLTGCRFCAAVAAPTKRLSSPASHEFGCPWRRARALYPDGVKHADAASGRAVPAVVNPNA